MRIDAHQHYWKLSRGDYSWITEELTILRRDYLPEHLQPHLHQQQIDKTIVVQAAPTLAETEFLLSLSEKDDSIAGVVGWLDLESSDYKAQFDRLRRHPRFVGFRIMIQDMEDPAVLLKSWYIEALRYFAELDVPVDLLLRADQLTWLLAVMEQVPNVRGVIDHLAKPNIAKAEWEPWKSQMSQLASYPSLYCKLSGMVTEADHQHWKAEELIRYIDHILQEFGPERVMYGSDWPVCLLAASYEEVIAVLEAAIAKQLTTAEKEQLFGGNAQIFYKL